MRPALARIVAAGLAAVILAAVGAVDAPAAPAASRPVLFVPLGAFPRSDAASLARRFERALGLEARVLSPSVIPRSAFDRARKQFVAENLIDVVAKRRTAENAQAVLIGLAAEDMYTRDRPDWRFSFSLRSTNGLAVVSRARMDPRTFGLFPDPALRMRRLRKMVMKNIGTLSLGLAQSRNPRSVLFDSVLSTDDLDYMTEDFEPSPRAERRRAGSSARPPSASGGWQRRGRWSHARHS